ncbi:hypothetical protein [Streptomyces globisporus]
MLCGSTGPGWVSLATRAAYVRSPRLAAKPGFTEAERFEEWGAEQWMGVGKGTWA